MKPGVLNMLTVKAEPALQRAAPVLLSASTDHMLRSPECNEVERSGRWRGFDRQG
jgi:hypothetical protein